MAMVLNQFIGSDLKSALTAQLETRNSRLASDCSWQFHPDFFEGIHFHGEAHPGLLVQTEAGRSNIGDLPDDQPWREDAAQAAGGDHLAGDELAVAREIF